MKGLYFYKLISAYKEDVTKNCKLTVNEIDSNFYNLKEADIKSASFDPQTQTLILKRVGGEILTVDLSDLVRGVVRNLVINYDKKGGVITFKYNGGEFVVDGLVTEDNLDDNILRQVYTDASLIGNGTPSNPLGINPLEKTGHYAPTDSYVDLIGGDKLPKNPITGTRLVARNYLSDYGLLYPYCGVENMVETLADLKSDWRVPSKADWDAMLNAIEPCEDDKTHDSTSCKELGYIAGKLLKSVNVEEIDGEEVKRWDFSEDIYTGGCGCHEDDTCCGKYHPRRKGIQPEGVDKYNMHIVAGGYSDFGNTVDYKYKRAGYWTTTPHGDEECRHYVKRFEFDTPMVVQGNASKNALYSVRLVKDYDGSNYYGYEFINGQLFQTKLMPCETSKTGFAVWTIDNVAFNDEIYRPQESAGEPFGEGYFVYEWDGSQWIVKPLDNGYEIIINKVWKDEKTNLIYPSIESAIEAGASEEDLVKVVGEFRMVDGELVAVDNSIVSLINEKGEEISDIKEEIEKIQSEAEAVVTGGTYDNATGICTMKARNPENNFDIQFNANFGEF